MDNAQKSYITPGKICTIAKLTTEEFTTSFCKPDG